MADVRGITELDIRVVRALQSGKYLQASMSLAQRAALKDAIDVVNPDRVVAKLVEMGVIAGFVPVISEDGARVLDAMEALYAHRKDADALSAFDTEPPAEAPPAAPQAPPATEATASPTTEPAQPDPSTTRIPGFHRCESCKSADRADFMEKRENGRWYHKSDAPAPERCVYFRHHRGATVDQMERELAGVPQ